jgi:predicted TIM-barrel fold metal-dependent hydrolase
MIQAWDADGHIYENVNTFSDDYWMDDSLRHRKPEILTSDRNGMMWFVIDDTLFPKRMGPSVHGGGNPASDGVNLSSGQKEKPYDPVETAEFRSAKDRLLQMDREQIALQVNYPTMFLSHPLSHDPNLGMAMARSYNNWIADMSNQAPDRLKWVTIVEPMSPKESAKEIERTKDMGSVGVMLLGTVGNGHIDAPEMEPIWAAAAETNLPVALHVGFSSPALGDMYPHPGEALCMPFGLSLLMGYQKVFASGVLDRYPNMRIAFLEAGCDWVNFLNERMEEYSGKPGTRLAMVNSGGAGRGAADAPVSTSAVSVLHSWYKSKGLPNDYIQDGRIFFGSEPDEGDMAHFAELYGNDCLLYASDIPHADRILNAAELVENRNDISQELKQKYLVDNVARFYGLTVPSGSPGAG